MLRGELLRGDEAEARLYKELWLSQDGGLLGQQYRLLSERWLLPKDWLLSKHWLGLSNLRVTFVSLRILTKLGSVLAELWCGLAKLWPSLSKLRPLANSWPLLTKS